MALFTIIVVCLTFGIGLVVVARHWRQVSRLLFFLLTVDISLWAIANWLSVSVPSSEALPWIRLVIFFAAPQLFLVFLFAHTFPKRTLQLSGPILWLSILLLVTIMILSLTPLIFQSIEERPGETVPVTVSGSGIYFFAGFIFLSLIVATTTVLQRYRQSSGILRQQWKYLLIGFTTTYVLDVVFLFLFAAFFQNTSFVPYANVFTLPLLAAAAYVIIRHRFFGIRFIVRKGTIYLGSIIIALSLYVALILSASSMIPTPTQTSAIMVNLIAAVAIALGFEPLRRWVRGRVDAWFFPERKRIQREIQRIQRDLPRQVNFEKYEAELLDAIGTVLSFREAHFFLLDKREAVYREIAPRRTPFMPLRLDDQMVKYIIGKWRILVRDELLLLLEDLPRIEQEEIMKIHTKMKELRAALALPIGDDKKPEGILLLDAAAREGAFTTDELTDLEHVRFAASQALFNAVLYKETIENIGKVRAG